MKRMKRFVICIASFLMTLGCGMAIAEGVASAPAAISSTSLPTDPFSWQYLATIAGATLATMLIVQLLKLPLDKVWKIPTRIVVYLIALVISLLATAFTTGLSWQEGLLTAVNAVIVALAAMGAYELTIKKLENK